jgi:hypothetical protein
MGTRENNLSKMTEQELFDMVAAPKCFTPEAIEAAKKELARRKLTPEQISQLLAGHSQLNTSSKAKWPTTMLLTVATWCHWPGFRRMDRLRRLDADHWTWITYGLLLWALIALIQLILLLI